MVAGIALTVGEQVHYFLYGRLASGSDTLKSASGGPKSGAGKMNRDTSAQAKLEGDLPPA
jgi:hypothetical protein